MKSQPAASGQPRVKVRHEARAAPPQGPAQLWTFHNCRAGSWAERGRPGRRAAGQVLRYGAPWQLGMQLPVVRVGGLPAGRHGDSGLLSRLWLLWVRAGLTPYGRMQKLALSSQSCSALLGRKEEEEGTSLRPNLRDQREEPRVPEAASIHTESELGWGY